MDSQQAIEKIKDRLIELIKNGKLNATTEQSDNSISFYIYKTPTETIPLITLRTSDHRPKFQKYIRPGIPSPSEEENMNLSVEFYKARSKEDGTKIRNRVDTGVNIPHGVDAIKPFTISSFSYKPENLNEDDIETIYQSIIEWIYSEPRTQYIDPFANTEKAAVSITKTANIKQSKRTTENKLYINTNKTVMKLNEEQLRKIIRESMQNVLSEGKVTNNKPLYATDEWDRDKVLKDEWMINPYYIDDNGNHIAITKDAKNKHFDRKHQKEQNEIISNYLNNQKEIDKEELLPLLRRWSITTLGFRELDKLRKKLNTIKGNDDVLYNMSFKDPSEVFDEFGLNWKCWEKLPEGVRLLLIWLAT